MGSGSSRHHKVDRQVQIPSASKTRAQTPPPQIIARPGSHTRRPLSSKKSPWKLKTNIPTTPLTSNIAHYASIWDENGKLSSTFQELIRAESIKMEHNQKEVNSYQSVKKNISKYETAQVESILTGEVESIHSLSTSEKLDQLILNLKQTHADFDESVKLRIEKITSETESILAQIVEETQLSQQQLLINAKEQQTIHDEQYQILLEQFIVELNEKRAKQLAIIQQQQQEERLNIFNESQLKIRAVNEQANFMKNQIMAEEESKASEKIDSIVTKINSITTESAIQNLTTEIKGKFNLTVHEVVQSDQSQFHDEHQHSNRQQNIKRTTYIETDITK